ncbi:hypothetical protein ES708_16275 [subsurface metagenome]
MSDSGIKVAAFDIFNKFRDFIPWVSLDTFEVGGDTGYTVTIYGDRLVVLQGGTANYDAWIKSASKWWGILETGTKTTIEIFLLSLLDVSAQNIWIRFAFTDLDPPSETDEHFGWKIIGADLYASNADGTTQKITDTGVNLAAGDQRTRLRIVVNPGVDIKFYVNDVLKVTHTDNLPAETKLYFHIQVRTTTTGYRSVNLGRVLVEKEYA